MPELSVNLDEVAKQIQEDLRVTNRDFIPKAQEIGIFRASRSALSNWVRSSAKEAKVPAKVLRGRSKNAKGKTGGRVLRIGTLAVSLGRLNPKKAARGGGYRAGGGRHYPGAFRIKARRGGSFITQREGQSRYPIKSVTVPVADIVRRNSRVATDRLAEQFPKEFERAIGVNLNRLSRRRNAQARRALNQASRF